MCLQHWCRQQEPRTMDCSSGKVSRNCSSSSSALSMRSAYSPMIQIMDALASGSSSVSRFSHSVAMMDSYLRIRWQDQRLLAAMQAAGLATVAS